MTSRRSLSWKNFEESIMVRDEQRTHRFDTTGIEVFFEGREVRIGALMPMAVGTEIPGALLASAALRSRLHDDRSPPQLEISTPTRHLFRHFYYLVTAVNERLELSGGEPIEALVEELATFHELVELKGALSPERQIGLAGELLFLEYLVVAHGASAALAWMGPSGQPHDFRIGSSEFEIKTTVRSRRVHRINGLDQLVPSAGSDLRLVSVLLGPGGAGGGIALPALVARVRTRLEHDQIAITHFDGQLALSGYVISDAHLYTRTYSLRRPMALIDIEGQVPRVTRAVLKSALGALSQRVDDISYEVDLEGITVEEISA